jgi:hypothetical protein
MPPNQAPQAKLYFTCWAAGLAIGQYQDARPLLDSLAVEGLPELAPNIVASHLLNAVPWPTGQLQTAWPELWPRVEEMVDASLASMEARTSTAGLAQQAKLALQAPVHSVPSVLETQSALTPDVYANHEAAERERQLRERQRYLAELEEAKTWLEQQVANWQRAVADR